MTSSRGRWAQLGGLLGWGGWWSREARSSWNTVRGRVNVGPWGFIKTTKPVCRKLQLQTTELHDSKGYRNDKLQNSKTADMPTDKLAKLFLTAWWPTRGRRISECAPYVFFADFRPGNLGEK